MWKDLQKFEIYNSDLAMDSTDRSPTLDEKIKALTSSIANIMCIAQLKPMAAANGRLKIHDLINRFALDVREEMHEKNREYSRRAYIAEKALKDAKLGEIDL